MLQIAKSKLISLDHIEFIAGIEMQKVKKKTNVKTTLLM